VAVPVLLTVPGPPLDPTPDPIPAPAPTSAALVDRPVPPTRPRARALLVLPLLLALVLGVGAALAPVATLVVAVTVSSSLVLLLRLEWAVPAVVVGAVFEGYLERLSVWVVPWLGLVLVLAWLVQRAHGPLQPHPLRLLAGPASLLVVALTASALVHPPGADGLAAALRWGGLAVVGLVLADALGSGRTGWLAPRTVARTYVLACTAAALCGLVTAVLTEQHRVVAPVGPVDSANGTAFFLLAALPLVGTVRPRREQPAWWVWACLAVLVLAGVGTQSRPAAVGLVVMTVLGVATGLLPWRRAGALLAVVVTLVAVLVAVLPVAVGDVLSDPQRYSDAGTTQRNDQRRAAWELARESPGLGHGPRAQPEQTAHSTVLESAAEIGVPGTLALYAGWLLPALAAVRGWRRTRARLTGAVLVALGGLVTVSLLESQQLALPLWLLAALAWSLGRPSPRRSPLLPADPEGRTSGQVAPGW
jgi:putative inorganic carbon (hco3(-)) transporter